MNYTALLKTAAKQLPVGVLGLFVGFNIATAICQFRQEICDPLQLVAIDALHAVGIDPESNLRKYGVFALVSGELLGATAGIIVDLFERPEVYRPNRAFYAVSR